VVLPPWLRHLRRRHPGLLSRAAAGSLIDTARWSAPSRPVAVAVLVRPDADVLFALTLQWLPSFGYGDGGLRNLILPAVALGVGPMALLARTTRAAVLDVLNADFVRTARSKGMSERLVVNGTCCATRWCW
jgi:ABC-type dipeptide/oligopeptide/nickel transport system permease component